MSVGSLQLVRPCGLVPFDSRQTKAQNVIFRKKNLGAPSARCFLGSSFDVLTSRTFLQDGHGSTLWQNIRVASPGPAHVSQAALYRTKASAAAVAAQSRRVASSSAKFAGFAIIRLTATIQKYPILVQCLPAAALILYSVWGLLPTARYLRRLINKEDSKWTSSRTLHVTSSYLRPLFLWIGVIVICRAFDPVILSSPASQAIKSRFINFVRSMSTVLAFAFCTARLTHYIQKTMMAGQDKQHNLGVQFIGNSVYTSVWVAAVCLFMELLGFSTQRWITAGGFGTVLLTLAGREIFTNFLSSIMIHATRPFIENEWIQTKIEGQEVSGTVEHVGWWSPTVIRGDDREAVHIPNHKFSVSVVRNLSQKTHWRIKTHFGVSHLDIGKITDIVADMRKVISKHPQVEQQRLHRRAFFDKIDPENQALLILVSCFVKTSHFEEYLRVKEIILLDLMRVISHHNARLATPIRSVQRVLEESEARNAPFRDASPTNERRKPTYMIEAKALAVNDVDEGDVVKMDGRHADAGKESGGKDTAKEMSSREAGRGAKPAAPLKAQQLGDTDSKSRKKPRDKVQVGTEAGLKSGPASSGDSSSAATAYPVGVESMGLNSSDLSRSAFEKPPVHAPRGVVNSASSIDIKQAQNDVDSETAEQQKVGSPSTASSSTGPVKFADGEKDTTSDPWRAQPQVHPEPSPVAASQKSETSTGGPRNSEEKVQSGHGQSPVSAPAPVPRLQSVEENLVLGVALDGPKRTLPLDDDIPSSTKPRELVTSSRNGNSSTPPKDRREPSMSSQPNSAGQGDNRDRER